MVDDITIIIAYLNIEPKMTQSPSGSKLGTIPTEKSQDFSNM